MTSFACAIGGAMATPMCHASYGAIGAVAGTDLPAEGTFL
jgi:hypothetical protein